MASSNWDKMPGERFRVEGNTVQVTPRFDPRYQPHAELELLRILCGLSDELPDSDVVLDLRESAAIPSMMLGCLNEAHDQIKKVGKRLRVRLKTDAYRRLEALGVWGRFHPTEHASQSGDVLEITATTDREEPRKG